MARVSFDFKKGDLVWVSLIVVLVGVGFVVAEWDSAKAVFHDSEDVKITIDGVDYSLQEALDDGLISGGMKFGTWVVVSPESASILAASNGFFIGTALLTSGNGDWGAHITGYTDDNINPIRKVGYASVSRSRDNLNGRSLANSFMIPVKAGDYYRADYTPDYGTPAVTRIYYWVPVISSGGGSGSSNTYDSGWFAVSTNTLYTKSHGLGVEPIMVQLWFSDTADGSGQQVLLAGGDWDTGNYQLNIIDVDSTEIKIRSANRLLLYYDNAGNQQVSGTGFARIKAIA